MGRLGLGAALAGLIFAAGLWSGATMSRARQTAEVEQARQAEAQAAALFRLRETERLRDEATLDLALGEVIENAQGLDLHHVVFNADRVRGLIPAR